MMLKILLADDLEICRKCLAMFLSRQGYHVLEAADGVEALRILKAERPDVAVVDLLMPELDGFEFVREARKDPAISGIPVIFLSASFPAESVKPIAASLGVRHILQKSFFQAPVLEAIKEILRGDGPLEVEDRAANCGVRMFGSQYGGVSQIVLSGERNRRSESFRDRRFGPPCGNRHGSFACLARVVSFSKCLNDTCLVLFGLCRLSLKHNGRPPEDRNCLSRLDNRRMDAIALSKASA